MIRKSEAQAPPASQLKAFFLCFLTFFVLASCGDQDDDQTRFGPADMVFRYRESLNPIIDAVSKIETEVQETAVGASGTATAANLATAYERLLPELGAIRALFEQIVPPRRLSRLHGLIGDLINLRMTAYNNVVRGFADDNEKLYDEAESLLAEANDQIPAINELLREVDVALATTFADRGIAAKYAGLELY